MSLWEPVGGGSVRAEWGRRSVEDPPAGPARTGGLGARGRLLLGNATVGSCAQPERVQRLAVALVSLPGCAFHLLSLPWAPLGIVK